MRVYFRTNCAITLTIPNGLTKEEAMEAIEQKLFRLTDKIEGTNDCFEFQMVKEDLYDMPYNDDGFVEDEWTEEED